MGKLTVCLRTGKPRSQQRYGKLLRHRRGLRIWHALTGVARELGRSDFVLTQITGVGVSVKENHLASRRIRLRGVKSPRGNHEKANERHQVLGIDSESEETQEAKSEVLADHSTEGQWFFFSTDREGGER